MIWKIEFSLVCSKDALWAKIWANLICMANISRNRKYFTKQLSAEVRSYRLLYLRIGNESFCAVL